MVTCSARYGEGLAEIWGLVAEHRRELEASGRFEQHRRHQLLSWLWTMVDEALRAAVREHPRVAALAAELEREVLAERLSPTRAAEQILDAFGVTRDGSASPGDL